MDSTYFSYNGIRSETMGVQLVKTKPGLIGEPYLPDKEIILERNIGEPISYIYGYQDNPAKYKITLTLDDGLYWTTVKRREIARWLDCGKFAEFYSVDDVNKLYFLCLEGDSELITNGNQQGYVELTFLSISPYTYTQKYQKIYDLSDISEPTTIEFDNLGDVSLFPELNILKYGDGELQITNLSNEGRVFLFSELFDGETVNMDNKKRLIQTSDPDLYRYDSFNMNWLELVYGSNKLEVKGACKIVFNYRFAMKG
ncbi:phage tail domain-containing protein [Chengkuizengella marina]|uniref:phage tail domain-containing protein n=1 Tax=Chengkuizengella marina TaxID=2507566 RepID=UPI001370A82A|nr:phage tail domain-containing protein [Chengkuizengella marina]